VTVSGASPRRDQSLRGHTSNFEAEDFPRHCPPAPAAGEGFAVMSGCAHGVAPVQGSCYLPDKEFRLVCYLWTAQVALLPEWRTDVAVNLPTSP
jgi:hypothetical protein